MKKIRHGPVFLQEFYTPDPSRKHLKQHNSLPELPCSKHMGATINQFFSSQPVSAERNLGGTRLLYRNNSPFKNTWSFDVKKVTAKLLISDESFSNDDVAVHSFVDARLEQVKLVFGWS